MSIDEFSIPAHVTKAIKEAGYPIDTQMQSHIQSWYDWYSGKDKWYKVAYTDLQGHSRKRDRMSIRPARRVASEWASLILNEDTEVAVDAPLANKWLGRFLDSSNFWPTGQMIVEKGFALGTAAWGLWFDVGDVGTAVKIRRYDARMIVPLSWDEEGVAECAFVTRATIKGRRHDQLQMHVLEDGTYHIKTMLFRDSQKADAESMGVIADFDTESPAKTFGIFKPAIENTCVDLSPYGMSVFADAVDAIKAVDLSFDSVFQEVDLTGVKVFMDESMIETKTVNGKVIPVPKTEHRLFRKLAGQDSTKDLYQVYSPDIRIDPLRGAFDVALAELGELCGFGQQYFMLDKAGGLKTATEVASDNSALMRNVRKHENAVRGAIQDVVTALLTCARIHCGAEIEEDFGAVSVTFDDSVIADTQTEKNLMLAEIAAGVLPKWRYAVEWYGMSEEEAKASLPDEQIVDIGF